MFEMSRHVTSGVVWSASRVCVWSSAGPGCVCCVSISTRRQSGRRSQVLHSTSAVLHTPACPWENNFISMFHQLNCTKHLVLLCIITFAQPCLFIPETLQSSCSIWLWILHHNKSSSLMGWAVVPQLVVIIILLLSRWCHDWTLPRFDFSKLKPHSYNLNSFVCYCN